MTLTSKTRGGGSGGSGGARKSRPRPSELELDRGAGAGGGEREHVPRSVARARVARATTHYAMCDGWRPCPLRERLPVPRLVDLARSGGSDVVVAVGAGIRLVTLGWGKREMRIAK